MLDLINENRARHGVSALRLDILASRVASKTASEASKGDYYGHWNLRGEKPYHRYAFAGGMDHVMENASMIQGGGPMTKDYAQVLSFIKKMHMLMYNETPPNDGHRRNILCLLYTSDAADDLLCVDLGGRRIIKKKKQNILLIAT